ncbi:MAG: type II toxin-antitoxin system RelE/ParE family toxin [bacterium]|nr:type II toxin-antitoxin system RelE/ParE family toxin [bacterium]
MNLLYLPKARAFIEALDSPLDARTNKMLDLLRDRGHELRMPFSKPVEDGVFELRVVGAVQIRLLYFFHSGTAIFVHALFKKTEQLSRRDIDYALRVRKAFIADT